MTITDFSSQVALRCKQAYGGMTASAINGVLSSMATSVAADTVTQPVRLMEPAAANHPGKKQASTPSGQLSLEIALVVKKGYGGSTLTSAQMGAALSTLAGAMPLPPQNTAAPAISGTVTVGSTLSVTTGTWTGVAPITYTYQWLRAGAPIFGATGSTYILAAADHTFMIGCMVNAQNPYGDTQAGAAPVGPVP
jgi:hypothetical protein